MDRSGKCCGTRKALCHDRRRHKDHRVPPGGRTAAFAVCPGRAATAAIMTVAGTVVGTGNGPGLGPIAGPRCDRTRLSGRRDETAGHRLMRGVATLIAAMQGDLLRPMAVRPTGLAGPHAPWRGDVVQPLPAKGIAPLRSPRTGTRQARRSRRTRSGGAYRTRRFLRQRANPKMAHAEIKRTSSEYAALTVHSSGPRSDNLRG